MHRQIATITVTVQLGVLSKFSAGSIEPPHQTGDVIALLSLRLQRIGFGATISAPHMHAYALEWLSDRLKPGSKVLDVGCGSGYLTACFGACSLGGFVRTATIGRHPV
eukprot:SAG11_NODE_12596_length_695_cov_1.080537_1_plen_107_part_10